MLYRLCRAHVQDLNNILGRILYQTAEALVLLFVTGLDSDVYKSLPSEQPNLTSFHGCTGALYLAMLFLAFINSMTVQPVVDTERSVRALHMSTLNFWTM